MLAVLVYRWPCCIYPLPPSKYVWAVPLLQLVLLWACPTHAWRLSWGQGAAWRLGHHNPYHHPTLFPVLPSRQNW